MFAVEQMWLTLFYVFSITIFEARFMDVGNISVTGKQGENKHQVKKQLMFSLIFYWA